MLNLMLIKRKFNFQKNLDAYFFRDKLDLDAGTNSSTSSKYTSKSTIFKTLKTRLR